MNISNLSAGKVTFEERQRNLVFLKTLYTLFAIELLIAVIWTSFAFGFYEEFGLGIKNYWEVAIVSGSICLILILVAFLVAPVQRIPLSIVIYILFTLCFMHFASWLSLIDPSGLVYYALWLLLAVAIAYAIYAWATSTYMNTLISILITGVATLLVFVGFLIFSEVSFLGLLLVLLAVLVFGFYINYDIRKMVRGGIQDYSREDPWSGAVRIWLESVFVFCRLIELLGRSCCK